MGHPVSCYDVLGSHKKQGHKFRHENETGNSAHFRSRLGLELSSAAEQRVQAVRRFRLHCG